MANRDAFFSALIEAETNYLRSAGWTPDGERWQNKELRYPAIPRDIAIQIQKDHDRRRLAPKN